MLNEKPSTVTLNIDASSLVSIKDIKGNIRLLDFGNHQIKKSEELLHVFNTQLSHFRLVPKVSTSFGKLGQPTQHEINIPSGKTIPYDTTILLQDEKTILLSYDIFYRFAFRDNTPFLKFSKLLLQNNIIGETESFIQKNLGIIIHKIWEQNLSGKEYSQVGNLINLENRMDADWIENKIKQPPQMNFNQETTAGFLFTAIQKGFIKIVFEVNYEIYRKI